LAPWPDFWKFWRAPSMVTLTRPKSWRPRTLTAAPGSFGVVVVVTLGTRSRISATPVGWSGCSSPRVQMLVGASAP
jgi:hypothetical protein